MKLTIERDALHEALGRATKIVEKRTTIPILAHILLRADAGGEVSITSKNLDQMVQTTIQADVARAGATTLEAARLAGIVANLPAGSQIAIDSDGAMTSVKSCRSSYKLQSLSPDDFPERRASAARLEFTLPAAQFVEIADRTEFAISSEETRYYLNGVFVHTIEVGGAMMLRAVATDGHKLSRVEIPAPAGAERLDGVIVPRVAMAEIKRLAKEADGPITIEIQASGISVNITTKGRRTIFTSKLIDGTFPDYTRVIPTNNNKAAVVDRDVFMAAIKRVAQINSERGKPEKLSFADDRLVISSNNPEAGEAVEEIDAAYSSPAIDIGFNAGYLAQALASFESDMVRVEMSDPGSPTIFTEREGASHLVIIMPMRY
jgi:DNA polymerase-3 subunit beta